MCSCQPTVLSTLLHEVVVEGGLVLLADAADRPYEFRRRQALLRRLCAPGGDFEFVDGGEMATTRIALRTRQGDEHAIASGVLRRVNS